jgi:hypothetical protein
VRYPTGTGSPKVDAFFEGYASDFVAKARRDGEAGPLSMGFPCEAGRNLYASSGFLAHAPSPRILGVLVTVESWMGVGEPDVGFRALNFNLATGEEIDLAWLFRDPARGARAVFGLAWGELCSATPRHGAAGRVMGVECGGGGTPPAPPLAGDRPLDSLGHLCLTEAGALLSLTPRELQGDFDGPYHMAIPKEGLLGLGARDVWAGGGG